MKVTEGFKRTVKATIVFDGYPNLPLPEGMTRQLQDIIEGAYQDAPLTAALASARLTVTVESVSDEPVSRNERYESVSTGGTSKTSIGVDLPDDCNAVSIFHGWLVPEEDTFYPKKGLHQFRLLTENRPQPAFVQETQRFRVE